MRRLLLLVVAALALGLLTAPAQGVAPPKTSYTEVEREVMCVECNVALNIAVSSSADRQREEIRRLVADGLDKDEILDRLVDQYGPNVLASPKAEGFNLLAYLVPVLGALALLLLGFALLPRWRAARATQEQAEADAPAPPELSDTDTARLDEELARFRA